MSTALVFAFILLGSLALFVWGKWRFDLVALLTLFACVAVGLVPPEQAFMGFGHPAVLTVAAVLILSRSLAISGVVDHIAQVILRYTQHRTSQIAALCLAVMVFSAFMNNIGALALFIPVALTIARQSDFSPSELLMPLSFASLLGGMLTLIGTPPNVIIATIRRDLVGEPFAMFDFFPAGIILALSGLVLILLLGPVLLPKDRKKSKSSGDIFEVTDYITELQVREDSAVIGQNLPLFESLEGGGHRVLGVIRGNRRIIAPAAQIVLAAGDILLVQAQARKLGEFIEKYGLGLLANAKIREDIDRAELNLLEVVISPRSRLVGRTALGLRLRSLYQVTLLAVARQGVPFKQRLRSVRLQAGDVLLLQGEKGVLQDVLPVLGCLPLATKTITFHPRRSFTPVLCFAGGILATVVTPIPAALALLGAALATVLLGGIQLDEAYEAIDWPVLVLLGAMIPVGDAMQSSGLTSYIVNFVTFYLADWGPLPVVAGLLVTTIILSSILNNAATTVVMAPLAVEMAVLLGYHPDPFLMTVAIGASCAFLTPIGHQNNILVMGPGSYRFRDFIRLGLPLTILVIVITVPLIGWLFPYS